MSGNVPTGVKSAVDVHVSRGRVGVKTGCPMFKIPKVIGQSNLLNNRVKRLECFRDINKNFKIISFFYV